MARQLEVADDLWPEERHDVREDAESEPGEQLLGDRRAAEDVTLLEDHSLHPGPGQVGGADEPVVAAADDHRVVALGHEPLHPLCIDFMHRVAEGPRRTGGVLHREEAGLVVRRGTSAGSVRGRNSYRPIG